MSRSFVQLTAFTVLLSGAYVTLYNCRPEDGHQDRICTFSAWLGSKIMTDGACLDGFVENCADCKSPQVAVVESSSCSASQEIEAMKMRSETVSIFTLINRNPLSCDKYPQDQSCPREASLKFCYYDWQKQSHSIYSTSCKLCKKLNTFKYRPESY